jgi:DNA invertase Pin-like site-specific DNA recombinase
MDKNAEIITVSLFEARERDYREALRLRRQEIRRLHSGGMSQQKIAEQWHLDISRVNRILKDEKKGQTK